MQKIKIKVKMISESHEEKDYDGSFNNDIISYIEDSNTRVDVNLNNSVITREDEEKLLVIDYRRETIHLNLKEFNYNFDMPIKSLNEYRKDKYFSIKYELEDKTIEYILEYEEI